MCRSVAAAFVLGASEKFQYLHQQPVQLAQPWPSLAIRAMVSCMCAHSQRAQCPVVENYFTGKTSAQFFVASRLSLHRALWYLRKRCFHLHAIRRIYSKPTHQVRSARTPVRSSDFVQNCVDLCGIVQVSNHTEKSGRRQDSLQHAPVVVQQQQACHQGGFWPHRACMCRPCVAIRPELTSIIVIQYRF